MRLVLQFTLFVPISLLTTLEIVKVVQGYIISRDRKMTYGDVKASTNSAGTADDLGCVLYIFISFDILYLPEEDAAELTISLVL
mmetsp:Transcript_24952/g.21287  ORF Transcript_24952/g.21287 Transcript_24952/m.21287 type:complete len:84 (+) Transcript_24952:3-254(+)